MSLKYILVLAYFIFFAIRHVNVQSLKTEHTFAMNRPT